jgi:hypothetical protein
MAASGWRLKLAKKASQAWRNNRHGGGEIVAKANQRSSK